MGFLQGIIADARSTVSAVVTEASRPVIAEHSERTNLPLSAGIEHSNTETGLREASGFGVAAHGSEFEQAVGELSEQSTPSRDSGYFSRYDSITTETLIPASDNDEQHGAALSMNVEYQGVDIQESQPAETVANRELNSSESYREPSVFSVMPAEADGVFQNDSLTSDALAMESDDSETSSALATYQQQLSSESASDQHDEPLWPDASGSLVAEHKIDSDNRQITSEEYEPPKMSAGSVGASSVQLIGTNAINELSEQTPLRKLIHPSLKKAEVSLPVELSREPILPNKNQQALEEFVKHEQQRLNVKVEMPERKSNNRRRNVLLAKTNKHQTDVTTGGSAKCERSMAQSGEPEGKGNSGFDILSAKTNKYQTSITTDRQRDTFQKETLSVGKHVLQQPTRNPDSAFIVPAPIPKVPEVRIGQVDVFIESPQKDKNATGSVRKIPQTFSSCHYLRRI